MLLKLSNLNWNLALTLGYLNPALNNSAQMVTLSPMHADALLMVNNSQHCWMLAVASVYTRCCMLFRVVHVGSCSAKFETGLNFYPLLPNFQQHSQWLHDKLTWFLLRALKAANLVVLSLIVFTGLGGLGLSICQKRHTKTINEF